jgi:hypothetical protein
VDALRADAAARARGLQRAALSELHRRLIVSPARVATRDLVRAAQIAGDSARDDEPRTSAPADDVPAVPADVAMAALRLVGAARALPVAPVSISPSPGRGADGLVGEDGARAGARGSRPDGGADPAARCAARGDAMLCGDSAGGSTSGCGATGCDAGNGGAMAAVMADGA